MNHIGEVKPAHGQKVWLRTWFDVNSHVAVYDAERNMWLVYGTSCPVSEDALRGDYWEPYLMTEGPRRGAIARCSQGHLGLITSDAPQMVLYPDQGAAVAWTGIYLEAGKIGEGWSSRNPTVVGHIDTLQAMLGWTAPAWAVDKLVTALRTHYAPDGRYYGPSNRMIGWVQEALELFEEAK